MASIKTLNAAPVVRSQASGVPPARHGLNWPFNVHAGCAWSMQVPRPGGWCVPVSLTIIIVTITLSTLLVNVEHSLGFKRYHDRRKTILTTTTVGRAGFRSFMLDRIAASNRDPAAGSEWKPTRLIPAAVNVGDSGPTDFNGALQC